jgi:hypothetical protein
MESHFLKLLERLDAAFKEGPPSAYLKLLAEDYIRVVPSDREALRADRNVVARIADQLARIEWQARKDGDFRVRLRACLLRVSLTDRGCDWRDALLDLRSIWRLAEARGIDPAPFYLEIADVSSAERTHRFAGSTFDGSTQGMIQSVAGWAKKVGAKPAKKWWQFWKA